MHKTHAKRRRDIKTKLMAAICMLLVSSIMMVSTTYAWFTLSTAPEVKGINTAVGANGNLEMALQPFDGESANIVSAVGDSMAAGTSPLESNITWGNLVDVSRSDIYGLNKIVLNPSKLATTETADGLAINANPLSYPTYGPDGRIIDLENKTITGVYNADDEKFLEGYTGTVGDKQYTLDKAYGVRAVGVSSGMSDRQLAYRAAMGDANTAAAQAKRVASQALNANGAALADIAIKHATTADAATETYSVAELQTIQTILNVLLGTDPNAVDGSLEYIESALINYALATGLADVADDGYEALQTSFADANLSNLAAKMTANTISIEGMDTWITELSEAYTNVRNAKTTIDGLITQAKDSYKWDDFEDALTLVANPNKMQVNKIAVSNLKGNWKYDEANDGPLPQGYTQNAEGFVLDEEGEIVSNMSRLVDAVLNDGIQLILASGAGVFADIADFCGNYSAEVTLSRISYGGMTVKNLDAHMSTKTSQPTTYLAAAQGKVPTFGGEGGSASAAISDFYGYIIDLAFRTNVAGSHLQLQAEAVDRIYSEGTVSGSTMGGGATMSFTSTVDTFTANQVKSLMSCLRIVFFNTNNNVIIGEARLDAESAIKDDTTGAITMELRMWDPTVEDTEGNAVGGWAANNHIMALEQNTITEMSVLVYLDGEKVTNADVANGVSSMTGTMNLQFSSDAALDPMDYTNLKEGTGEDTPATPTPTFTQSDVTAGTVSDGYTVATFKHVTDGTNHKLVAIITKDAAEVKSGVTVQIGDKNATYTTVGTFSGWVVDAEADAPTQTINVTVTTN